jgi:RNA-binding protein YlmH
VKRTFYSGNSEDERQLISRIEDALGAVGRYPRFLGFYDMHQRGVAIRVLEENSTRGCQYAFWGGYEGAERVYLGLFDAQETVEIDAFPLAGLKFTWKFGELTHRDFLGALLSLGLKREKLGDINAGECECSLVLDAAISGFVQQNLLKVGGSGVSCVSSDLKDVKKHQNYSDIADTVASARLDCVVAALVNVSRSEAEKLILNGSVAIDFETATNTAAKASEGSTVSIRGHGRFIIDSISSFTKKGRLRFAARKYL